MNTSEWSLSTETVFNRNTVQLLQLVIKLKEECEDKVESLDNRQREEREEHDRMNFDIIYSK